jgi:N utilization substance protein B
MQRPQQAKMPENISPKSAGSRRLERAKAFQILYGLCFDPPVNQSDLARRFQRAIYAEPVPGSVFFVELYPEQDEQADDGAALSQAGDPAPPSAKKESFRLPDIHASCPEDEENERIVTPSHQAGKAKPEGLAWELVRGVWSKQAELDELIRSFSQNWRLERMGKVELSLLRMAAYELLFSADVPPKVIINEAIELSRQFGDEHSHGFVNGILDAAIKAVNKADVKAVQL